MNYKHYVVYLKSYLQYLCNKHKYFDLEKVNVANTDESIDYLLSYKVSMSRYGDGEFQLVWQYMTGKDLLTKGTFQDYDAQLAKRLVEILSDKEYDNNKHIVCLPYFFFSGDTRNYKWTTKWFIYNYINKYHSLFLTSINTNRQYYNTNITRFYMDFKDKTMSHTQIERLSKLWEGRNVCFIEGEKSRLGVGNDLFANTATITRILCPARSAFDKYDEIIAAAKVQPSDTLFLLALGMTATVLAYDLSKLGFQALDLGHIDIEYEWMKMGAKEKVAIPHKYTNEAQGGKVVADETDEKYQSQIIVRIGC